MNVPNVTLSNGIVMPQLGLGVYKAQNGEEVENAIHRALETGYRAIDTAMIYGNEESVGRAIRESGIDRSELFITTKLWNDDQGYESTLQAFEASMQRLGLDYLDLYLIHWPMPKVGRFAETWRAFEKLYTDGRIRAIGVSNFSPAHLEELARTATITPMVNQVELHPFLTQKALREYCQAHDIRVESWSPIMRGGDVLTNQTITSIAQNYSKTPAQVVLRWHIQHNLIVIPKSVHEERIRENFEIFDFELNSEEMAAIDSLDRGERVGPDPDELNG
jgi:diketogulonate reductase-like aldo/keto reductase